MDRLLDRADRCLYSGYGISFLVHLTIISGLLLTLLPMGLHRDPIDLEVTVDEPGAELVVLDVMLAQPEMTAEDEPLLLDVLGAQEEASLDVTFALTNLATGEKGTGKNHVTAGTATGNNGGQGQASFFGTQANGNRFVYVLDVSGSMNKGSGRRLRRAVNELLRSIEQLHEEQLFYVLLFASSTRQMFDEESLTPAMLPATEENKTRLREWLNSIKATGSTHPQRALHVGLKLSPSAVFFLSDGKFNKPKPAGFLGGEVVDAKTVVERSNPGKIPVHSIAFEDPASRRNMNEISKLTGGDYRFVTSGGRVTGTGLAKAAAGSKKEKESLAERKAAKWLGFADDMEAIKNERMAKYYYTKILKDFPDTKTAQEVLRRQAGE